MKTIKTIMNVPIDVYTRFMARGLSLGTPLNEVLDKIKDEIVEKSYINFEDYKAIDLDDALQIIDKYRE